MTEVKIKDALIRLHLGIKKSDGPAISACLVELDEICAKNADSLPPQLVHFLEGRSYAKALAYLGGSELLDAKPASPPGGCSGGHS